MLHLVSGTNYLRLSLIIYGHGEKSERSVVKFSHVLHTFFT